LFSDDRRPATPQQTTDRQWAKARGIAATDAAFAAPTEYNDTLKTIVVPYRKATASSPSCFAFNAVVPETAASTQVLIVDADSALSGGYDPQSSWTFTWPQKVVFRGKQHKRAK
jgi:hypothetical protein